MTKTTGRKTKKTGQGHGIVQAARTGREGIGRLFAGRAIPGLLRVFLLNPSRDFYQRELTVSTGERLFLVQMALRRLLYAGLIDRVSRGNRIYYRANQSHPAFNDLKALILKTVGLGDSLRAQLRRLEGKVEVAFLYGSVARGEENVASDIDIMLIGGVSGREVASVLGPVKRLVNREINPSVYRPRELRKKFAQGLPFVREVVAGPKIFLLGDERALKAIIG
ncbi:MAG: nucleotidyltransferase domain-containing protein [Candidatus Rokubacteria bacterium]|nr:nucleotidyltransferase domain-containing protein [Candidatus Rokubacteria bacterium]